MSLSKGLKVGLVEGTTALSIGLATVCCYHGIKRFNNKKEKNLDITGNIEKKDIDPIIEVAEEPIVKPLEVAKKGPAIFFPHC